MMRLLLVVAFCGLGVVMAQPGYTGSDSFINSFQNISQPTVLDLGLQLNIVSAGVAYGLSVAGLSAWKVKLPPCTILQPHSHPHNEFAYTLAGKLTHSTPFNNLTLATLSPNNGVADCAVGGFATFAAGQLHVTYNEGCEDAVLLSVFGSPYPSINWFPYAQSLLPGEITEAFLRSDSCTLDSKDLGMRMGAAKLPGCSCETKSSKDSSHRKFA